MTRNILLIAGLIIAISACDDDENSGSNKTNFSLYLTDSPGDYEEVLIDIQDVKINPSGIDDEESWISLDNVSTGIYNLLDFTNGIDTLLAEQELPAGRISQMRLVLGHNNQVKIDGVYYNLKTPSAQQSGLKLNIHAELLEGIDYHIWIDFDAERSVGEQGNGKYLLKPVIRTYTDATSGAIKGIINPVKAKPYVMAISTENDTIGTNADTLSGYFIISGLSAGSYKINVLPTEGFETKIMESILVSTGVVYDLDTVIVSKI